MISPGSSSVSWSSVGGISLSTPQWAGLIAIANATRALASKPALGAPHAVLYGQIATVPGNYASVFADITLGANGTCATCSAKIGYDTLSGLGTPNGANLLMALGGATSATAPIATSAPISGTVGTALSFNIAVTASNPVTYALSAAPSGMAISSAGGMTWAVPVTGTYAVTVTAKDSKTGLSGKGVITVVIAAQSPPGITAAVISGKPGMPLSFIVGVTSPNPVTYAISGAPPGMTTKGSTVSWANPVAGTYTVTITAKDSKTGLSGQGVMTVKIVTAGPLITAPAMTGVAGKALSGTISIAAPAPGRYRSRSTAYRWA